MHSNIPYARFGKYGNIPKRSPLCQGEPAGAVLCFWGGIAAMRPFGCLWAGFAEAARACKITPRFRVHGATAAVDISADAGGKDGP